MPRIDIKGEIVSNEDKWIYDWYGMEAVCPSDVTEQLSDARGEPVDLYIGSPGGDITAGSEIYSAIALYQGPVNIYITSLAGSAASVIAMAGHSIMMPTALMMVHNVSISGASGDHNDMQKYAEMLEAANAAMANAYVTKTGMSMEEALKMMEEETWMDARAAKGRGLVDEVMDFSNKQSYRMENLFPSARISHAMRNRAEEGLRQAREREERKKNLMEALNFYGSSRKGM